MTTETRFAFGRNWADYAKSVGDEELNAAIWGLRKLLPTGFDPTGKSFLDIGSGSGIHAVAAHRLGFGHITATDYDENSVRTTQAVAVKFDAPVEAFRDDILHTSITGQFDVVYSWGVLHHTGDMKRAVENARRLVRQGGLFIIAIYLRTQFCPMWKVIKRSYSSGSPIRQRLMAAAYISALRARGLGGTGRGRGMDFRHDAIDWLGGYPYESASAEEVGQMAGSEFDLLTSFDTKPGRGLFGTGCGEYVFSRRSIE